MEKQAAFHCVLTVAEGKRLIARAVAALPCVRRALAEGTVVVTKGTTNAYVAEELLGTKIPKGAYVLGRTVPAGSEHKTVFEGKMSEVVFVRGKHVEMPLAEAVENLKRGDVVIKGANALNYAQKTAGLLVGHPSGGTIAAVLGTVYGRGVHLVIPVGLEKQVSEDISDRAGWMMRRPEYIRENMPSLWPIQGEIITELEALSGLTGVEAFQLAAGGICGAEGGIWLGGCGTEEAVANARQLVEDIQGEPLFGCE